MEIKSKELNWLEQLTVASEEVSNDELKKQSNQAKRIANTAFKNHTHAEAVKDALNVLQPQELLYILKNTQSALVGMGGSVSFEQQDAPQLQKPQPALATARNIGTDTGTSKSSLTANAQFIELIGRVIELNQQGSVQNQIAKLNMFNAIFSGTVTQFNELAEELTSLGQAYANLQDTYDASSEKSTALKNELTNAQNKLKEKQNVLKKLEAQATKYNPVPASLQQQISEAKNAVTVAAAAVTDAEKKYTNYVTGPLNHAEAAMNQAKIALNEAISRSRALLQGLPAQMVNTVEAHRQEQSENNLTLEFLMALMHQLIAQTTNKELSAAAKLKQDLAEASVRSAEKKDIEYKEQVRKAEEMQKTMSCVGKILGWIITTVSFAAAIFTGGASLAIAAVGLALALADEIHQAVTGVSFMQQAMQPILEKVVLPLMNFIAQQISLVLVKVGVDKEIADRVGQIMGAIYAAAAMIAAMVVAGAVVGKVAAVVGRKMMNNIVGQTVKRMMQNISKKLMSSLNNSSTKFAQSLNRVNRAINVMSFANEGISVGLNISTSIMMVDAEKIKAALIKLMTMQEIMDKFLENIIDTFSKKIELLNKTFENLTDTLKQQAKTGKFIANRIGIVAV